MLDRHDFARWLIEEGYASTTQRTTLAELDATLRRVERGEPIPSRLGPIMRRVERYLEARGLGLDAGLARSLRGLEAAAKGSRVGGRKRKKRKNLAHGLSDAEWSALWTVVREDTADTARVLEAMMVSGLRVGDVLGIDREALRRGVEHNVLRLRVKGGAERQIFTDPAPVTWKGLYELFKGLGSDEATNVASAICGDADATAAGCAYYAVRRRLVTLGKRAGIEGRVHTHRLRRTVAVQALRHTGDLVAVQQLLGHSSIASTSRYVDEAQPERVAQLQREIGKRFRAESD